MCGLLYNRTRPRAANALAARRLENVVEAACCTHHSSSYAAVHRDRPDTAAADGGDAPRACVLWIHGGGWRAGSKSHIPACMLPVLAEGFMVASVGYRKSTTARFPACIHDCKMAVRFLRAESATLGVDPARIGVVGSSAGGHLAMLMAFADDALDGLHVRPCAWMSLCPCIRACTQAIAHILITRWPARACGSVQPRSGYREYSRT